MELTHTFTVPTSVDEAWTMFMDLERVGGCFPGATVSEVTHDGFSGTVKVKLGPIALVYSGSGSIVQRDDLVHHAVIEAKGKDKRGNGTAGATVTIRLSGADGGTRADVVTDLSVTGKPAQFGRGVMQDVSDKLLQAFVACIEKQLRGPDASGDAGSPSPAASEPAADDSPATGFVETGFVETGSDALAADTGTAPVSPVASSVSAAPPRGRSVSDDEQDAALDLGSTVLPVLVQRYAGYAAAGAVGIVLGWLIGASGRRARR